jgi:D-sedoheptulose 7-phosphate isomerase
MSQTHWKSHVDRLSLALHGPALVQVEKSARTLNRARDSGRAVYLCGNGGSACNAIHLANDFIFAAEGKKSGRALHAEALCANPAIVTCLANELGYGEIFAAQLRVKAQPDDVLIVLSGSGNSANVVRALEVGAELGGHTFANFAFQGGSCRKIVQTALPFPVEDMKAAEDIRLAVGHMEVQWLSYHD